jgi:hypothetical protein
MQLKILKNNELYVDWLFNNNLRSKIELEDSVLNVTVLSKVGSRLAEISPVVSSSPSITKPTEEKVPEKSVKGCVNVNADADSDDIAKMTVVNNADNEG